MNLIIGQGAAGVHAATELRRLDPAVRVTILTAEPDPFYSRIDLPDIVAGSLSADDAELKSPADFEAAGIICRYGTTVTRIDPANQVVELADGDILSFRRLLIATGSSPAKPPIPGVDLAGVHTLWTLAQARCLAEAAPRSQQAIVVGAGLIGLKTALALAKRGLTVRVVECLDRVLAKQLDAEAAGIVTEALREHGVEVLTGVCVQQFKAGEKGRLAGAILSDREIACDLAVIASGVRPNADLAKAAGLEVRRGIVVDSCLRTTAPNIWAAGDVAEVTDPLSGEPVVPAAWPVAVSQGVIAARNMLGAGLAWESSVAMNSVEVAGIPLVSVGSPEAADGDQVLKTRSGNNYRRIVLRDHKVRGLVCLGDIRSAGVLTGLISRGVCCNDPERLLTPRFCASDLLNF
mgnify:FL=1|jgi:NAD(P)H-nitrite reductase large subunit